MKNSAHEPGRPEPLLPFRRAFDGLAAVILGGLPAVLLDGVQQRPILIKLGLAHWAVLLVALASAFRTKKRFGHWWLSEGRWPYSTIDGDTSRTPRHSRASFRCLAIVRFFSPRLVKVLPLHFSEIPLSSPFVTFLSIAAPKTWSAASLPSGRVSWTSISSSQTRSCPPSAFPS